jgi:uncharacterized protein (DUF1697 family)
MEGLSGRPCQNPAMTRYVGFVRNVMVGRSGLSRDVLLGAFRDAGGADPVSYLATGNVSFDATEATLAQVIGSVETTVAEVLDRHEPVFVRGLSHLAGLVAVRPFAAFDRLDVRERCVTFLPDGQTWTHRLPFSPPRNDVTLIAANGACVFSVTRLVGGRPGTAGPIVERELGEPVTTRNWNTVERIVRAHG